MVRTLKELQSWAAEYGYYVEKSPYHYEWWHKSDNGVIGLCSTIRETYQEIQDSIIYNLACCRLFLD